MSDFRIDLTTNNPLIASLYTVSDPISKGTTPALANFLITEDNNPITTEDDFNLITET